MLVVAAYFTCKQGAREQFLVEMQKLVDGTRKEEGCISFTLYESAENAGRFILFEEWSGKEALEPHRLTEHYVAYSKISDKIIESREVKMYETKD